MLDESLLITQETRAAWNVQLEVAADHRGDADQLRQAVRWCCQRHPMARARLAPADTHGNYSQWDIANDVDRDPLRVVDCPDATALAALRAELYTPPIALDVSPGFRIAVARRPGGDLVLLATSHIVADGVGAVRLMQTIARTYRGEPDPPDPFPLAEARDVGSFLAPRTRSEKWARELELLRRLHEALEQPSRIAAVSDADRGGFGLVFRVLDIGEATPGLVQRPSDTTINDVLVAALHLTVQCWNTQHNVPSERIAVMMPINIRPADRLWDVVSNLTSMVSV
ncbi:MAG TPA: condensation domain-containing protein, partial [Chloroflexota bacterium]|nr:condensation domain-containing protein [Chloroflexota bacterium]